MQFNRIAQVKAAIAAVAFVALFWNLLDFIPPKLGVLVHRWLNDSDWSHGPIIPLFSAYLIYTRWDDIRRLAVRWAWVGLPILVAGLLFWLYALLNLTFGYFKPLSMMVTLLGMIILLCGLPAMRYLWVPYLYLFFAIPLPQSIYFRLTDPLQKLAAMFATSVLTLMPDLDIVRDQIHITALRLGDPEPHQLTVDDACSGMRSTMTLCALGVAIAFLSERPWWQRAILVASCVPIAVFCNFIRVLITCYLHIYAGEEYATGNAHLALGLVMLGVAFGLFSGLGWILKNLFVTEPEEPDGADRRPAGSAT